MTRLNERRTAWQEKTVARTLARAPERQTEFSVSSGIPIDRLYAPATCCPAAEEAYLEQLGFPGEYPFTRGVQPTMYRARFWTMRQYAGFGAAAESNRRFKYLLAQGQTGLSVAFDLPTQIGYDSDDPLALGEVGKVGVAIASLADMETLLDGIPLDKASISMTINAPAAILLAMVIAVAKKQGVDPAALRGTVQNDILKEYIARGTYIFPPAASMRLITDLFRYAGQTLPNWNTISISGYHIREAGSTAVQEVAFTLANAIEYVKAALDAGLAVDDFAPQLTFFFNAHNNFLEEVAKFRASRRLWAKIMRERFGAKDPKSWQLRFHTQTAGSTLTAQQPENNVVRVTLQALAAVLGGTQSLHTNSRDEALALPSEAAVEVALRTQQIIAHEAGVADTVDPLAGSYYVEHLTDEIERRARQYIEKIDGMGGAAAAIERGYIQHEIQEAAYAVCRAIESGEQVVVGVNRYQGSRAASPADLLKIDETVQAEQIRRLQAVRASRNAAAVADVLKRIRAAAQDPTAALMPLFVEAAEAYVTLGEMCNTLRGVFGEYRP
ncbi:MAG: methylmalonyl-CoA mutase [Chloroflexi bacterium]|nr:methylmalonyl-CoA mutase [Chloroflexota bacterium]